MLGMMPGWERRCDPRYCCVTPLIRLQDPRGGASLYPRRGCKPLRIFRPKLPKDQTSFLAPVEPEEGKEWPCRGKAGTQ